MLRIEKLFLQGFKSFCDPTELVFDEEAITAVVGPNGCGKSNVADAINWVLGEQRAKSLRGGKMEDVIFQGSRNRQPSGMAEVLLTMVVRERFEVRGAAGAEVGALQQAEASLTQAQTAADSIDQALAVAEPQPPPEGEAQTQEEGSQPIDVETKTLASLPAEPAAPRTTKRKPVTGPSLSFEAGERITIGRRLYRTGESEYEMNGRGCRLRDIQDLFAGTGLGAAHYAIIEQGRIGQVLSAKPLDRRALIEEAAGISKFKMRQHSAELKLEASKQNLSRITDIILEIDRQQGSLKRQAQKARRYQRLREEMRELMRAVFVVDYRRVTGLLGELDSSLGQLTARATGLTAALTDAEGAQAVTAQEGRAAEEALEEARRAVAELELELARGRSQHDYARERIANLGARTQQFTRDQEMIGERERVLAQELERLRGELGVIEGEINTESKSLVDEEAEHQARSRADADAERELGELQQKQLVEAAGTRERWRQQQRQFADAVERGQSRWRGLEVERERATSQAQAAEEQFALASEKIETAGAQRQTIMEELAELTAHLAAARGTRTELQTALAALEQQATRAEQRIESLTQIDQRHMYFSEPVQTLIDEANNRTGNHAGAHSFKILGTLADFVAVTPEYETLVETALNEELQYLLVPSFADAARAIEFLKASGAGRATFLVVEPRPDHHHTEPSFVPANTLTVSAVEADTLRSADEAHILPDALTTEATQFDPGLVSDSAPASHQNGYDAHAANSYELRPAVLSAAHESAYQTLDEVLALKPELAAVFHASLPHLSGAVIVESIDQASYALHGQRQHTPVALVKTGERVAAGRVVTGGGAADQSLGVLTLRREIGELKTRLRELLTEADELRSSLGRTEAEIARHEERQRVIDGVLRQTEQQLAVQREQLQQYGRERERAATHIRVVAQELSQLEAEQQELEAKRQQAAQQTAAADQAQNEIEAAATEARTRLQQMRESTGLRSQELAHRRAAFAARTERRRGLQNDIRRLEYEATDLESRAARNRLEAVEADDQRQTLQATLTSTAQQLEHLGAEHSSAAAELDSRTATLAAARQKLDAWEMELRAAREELTQTRDARARNEIEQAKLTSDLEHLLQACHNELGEDLRAVCRRLDERASGLDAERASSSNEIHQAGGADKNDGDGATETDGGGAPSEADAPNTPTTAHFPNSLNTLPSQPFDDEENQGSLSDGSQYQEEMGSGFAFWSVPEDFDLADAKVRLAELRAKIDALGPVNMMALEELTEVEERFFFLSNQKSDIERAIADTQSAIAEIKSRSRERFREAFYIINENFKQMFQELFGGGQGEMRLIDESDILESGIEIIAQPPGKRLQNVLLLSGGEKAMTALSLVMAIFKYRPSPFCLLDEVDAPLDEVNIGRFADKVLEMSANTQFTIITHSKRTMEAARTLYGVTMEDPGVSKLVSVKLN